jgi:hypothetical protein
MYVKNLNAYAIVKFEVGSSTVLYRYASYCHSFTSIKPQCLFTKNTIIHRKSETL